jgi:hypothetical protein
MRTRRRIFALAAAFAVAFGSLWPLVSAAMPRSPEFPQFLCTQSGFQHPGVPADHDDKFHCPLCVMSVDAAPPAIVAQAALVVVSRVAEVATPDATCHPFPSARPPPSRAPPIGS